ncbi:MAG TPA: hypothetical protein VIY53_20315 [Acidobacteriaceae bacterium]
MGTSALELMGEAIDALQNADAARLERLAREAAGAEGPRNEKEGQALTGKRLALRRLLALTRRNLRLLRQPGADADIYGAPRV